MSGSAHIVNVGFSMAQNPDAGVELKNQSCVVGIDLGGTKLLAGIANSKGDILHTLEQPTSHGENGSVLDQMAHMIASLLEAAGRQQDDLLQVVIGIPAAVDPHTGLASLSPNLRLPADRSLAELMAQTVTCPISVENDVNLAAFAEAVAAKPNKGEALAFISFGTGVGMGLVINGELWRGAFGRAGEIGFLPLGAKPHDHAPASENGLYEDAVGTHGIRARFTAGGATVADLFNAARQGNQEAMDAIDEVARSASIGLAAVHALLDPSVTVIGGGIGTQPEFFAALKTHLQALLPFDCKVEQSRFGANAGLMGAVMLAIKQAGAQNMLVPQSAS